MKKDLLSIIITFVALTLIPGLTHSSEATSIGKYSNIQVTNNLTSMPLSFTENQGQWDEKVKFRANAGGATMWFASDGAYYQFTRTIEYGPTSVIDKTYGMSDDMSDRQPDSVETMMIKANFVGANLNPQMIGVDMIKYKCNYFIGNDKSKWATDVPNYTAVLYEEIYDGIDLKYYGNGTQMEYDFIVEPGADYSQIKIQYEGAESVSVNDGELVVTTMWGEVIEQRPVIYQIENNSRIAVNGKYLLEDNNSFSFELNEYNPELPLVIDPVLSYSTYLGGSSDDIGRDIAVDASGATYVTGRTHSTDFPTLNPYQGTHQGGYKDIFVTKLSSSGGSLVYSTYLGGSGDDDGYGIVVDTFGAAYVTGETQSTDFPTLNPYQGTHQGGDYAYDVFVTKLSSSGNSLVYSTYLGGSGSDRGEGIIVDAFGAAYLTGSTRSTDFPTLNPYQGTYLGGGVNAYDAFVTKLSFSGNSLVYSTYLAGNDFDYGSSIAVDVYGSAYVTGGTRSTDFPTLNPYQGTHQGSNDIFVIKLSSSGDSLVYSTYLGGSDADFGSGIAVDASGATYLTGVTTSPDFPTFNPHSGTLQGGEDAFVTKLSSSGNSLVYSTYLGGSRDDRAQGIAVDASGAAYVTGETGSADFPTLIPYQGKNSGININDAFVTKLSSSGNSLVYSTYLGGSEYDEGYGIAVDASGAAYVTGETNSTDFLAINPNQKPRQDNDSPLAFVIKIGEGIDSDFDWVSDEFDNCIDVSNSSQDDIDADGVGNSCDNCLTDYNPDQLDSDNNGIGDACDSVATDIENPNDISAIPKMFNISQNYPNPFNPQTVVEYSLPQRSDVLIEIINIKGQVIRTLVNSSVGAGVYQIVWDGNNAYGRKVSSGVYLYRIQAGDYIKTKKMLMLK